MTKAVLICGHGSRSRAAVSQFEAMAERLRKRLPFPADYGFLEFASPTLSQTLDGLREAGHDEIYALPAMLFAAGHAKNDIPALLNDYQQKHGIKISYGRELGLDAKMLYAARDRIGEAMGDFSQTDRHKTLLVVVGRGASDPDANGNVAKLTRLLWEAMGFGWAETVYSGVTFPLVRPGLAHAARLGFERIVVFPYFLFTGILIDRIYSHTDEVAKAHPEITFIKAPYLNDHPLVEEVFEERLSEIDRGENKMNCQLCKYRTAFPAFEAEKGLRQESHHHHVEGAGLEDEHHHSPDGKHNHAPPHGHEHTHTHMPYPHSDHPLGQPSLKEE